MGNGDKDHERTSERPYGPAMECMAGAKNALPSKPEAIRLR